MNGAALTILRTNGPYYVKTTVRYASAKCGSMLSTLVTGKKQGSKKSFVEPVNVKAKRSIFEHVSRPRKRVAVLNNTFIECITDVISTGDIAPEFTGCGIEITRVHVCKGYNNLLVFWEMPPERYDELPDIENILAMRAPSIRVEMISRNLLGRVPHILFIRDKTNARLSAFEKALATADLGPKELQNVIPDQGFLKDVLKFNEARMAKNLKLIEEGKIKKQQKYESVPVLPTDTVNMKNDILGLNHSVLMVHVTNLKHREKFEGQQMVQSSNDDLFSKIPGVPLRSNVDRSKILHEFCLKRKKELQELLASKEVYSKNSYEDDDDSSEMPLDNLDPHFEWDYFEEEQLSDEIR